MSDKRQSVLPAWRDGLVQRMSVPSFISLELTTACNEQCPFCYLRTDPLSVPVSPVNMDYSLFQKIVIEAAEAGVTAILLTGGEPLLYPRLAECVELISSRGILAILSTSGAELTEELVIDLKKAGLSEACVSLNGSTEEIHNLSRTNFSAAKHAIELFAGNRVRTCVNWVASRDNLEDFPNLFSLCRAMGANVTDILAYKSCGDRPDFIPGSNELVRLSDMVMDSGMGYVTIDLCYGKLSRLVRNAPVRPFGGKCAGGRVKFDVLTTGEKTICRHIDPAGAPETIDMSLQQYWHVAEKRMVNKETPCQEMWERR